MAEWRLFEEGTVPEFTTPAFFAIHPWISPAHQLGHAQRMRMVEELICRVYTESSFTSLSDIGCGDGSLLDSLIDLPVPMWGYDAGEANVAQALASGLDVRQADVLTGKLEYGDLIVATEIVEHLMDPHGFIADLPGTKLVLSSPSAETDEWHYEHHAWCWDLAGYHKLVEDGGWTVQYQTECLADVNHHNGETREQRFQAIFCTRDA